MCLTITNLNSDTFFFDDRASFSQFFGPAVMLESNLAECALAVTGSGRFANSWKGAVVLEANTGNSSKLCIEGLNFRTDASV